MIVVQCPHCQEYLEIEEINCGIFRHGVYKTSGEQLYPHLDQRSCEQLVASDQIYGCGKPFQVVFAEGAYIVSICGYI